MERGKAFSIILGRLQQELRDAYGADNARKVLQAIMDTMKCRAGETCPSALGAFRVSAALAR